uniref:TATA box binding protein associated factor (TAF) histone-like fold domain-containing protein n=1 Tax=Sexangularia sp. CB-2014 TaxID=1486929 RepID=A0A7S1YKD3_9EUKA|mmetsp:Transcript_6940/g.22269  ORF Transcript_6940/g.22269 Transcript_6940/m.22269 type:complete len:403 (+) Transcript_6940:65-1273(+)
MANIIPDDSIRAYAETIGMLNLDTEVVNGVAAEVEFRTREILFEATKMMRHSKRERLLPSDIDAALRIRCYDPIHGHAGASARPRFSRTATDVDLFFLADAPVDLEVAAAAEVPPVPRNMTLTAHWLAVEGVQPAIPQNPLHKLEASPATAPGLAEDAHGASGVSVRPLVRHVISEELQQYFERVTAAIDGAASTGDADLIARVSDALRVDAGLQPIVPYLVRHANEGIRADLSAAPSLRVRLRALASLLMNQDLDPEPYLHQVMPLVLTCIVARQLGSADDEHWAVRDDAVNMLQLIMDRHGEAYPTLRPRTAKTLLSAWLDANRPFCADYGAVCALSVLSKASIRDVIVPSVLAYNEAKLAKGLKDKDADAQKVKVALQRIVESLNEPGTVPEEVKKVLA